MFSAGMFSAGKNFLAMGEQSSPSDLEKQNLPA